jgi:hypothetical protein
MIEGLNLKSNVMGTNKLKKMIEKEHNIFEDEVSAMSAVSNILSICGYLVHDSPCLAWNHGPLAERKEYFEKICRTLLQANER